LKEISVEFSNYKKKASAALREAEEKGKRVIGEERGG
jgi:hypothetical protein